MANLLSVTPTNSPITGLPSGNAWYQFDDGRSYLRPLDRPAPAAKSDFPTPMICRGFDSPVQSMADGRFYTDKAALERTYRADGNPQGVEYMCMGDTPVEPYKRPVKDLAPLDAAISRACEEAGL